MPVRSLRSSVLRWPDHDQVERAARAFAADAAARDPGVLEVGLFGSYARGSAGVGSDLDLVVVVRHTHVPFVRRSLAYDVSALPVPADVLVYTEAEWQRMTAEGGLPRTVAGEVLWLLDRA